ncbi:transposase [Oceanisphaera pacifica]|uniref:Transposase n=1 Tax=Oceanisphaera pacifica TaxID=2818389 RepID=A0ABS3NF97_9GAMM|nr:transposase [Oceanisphaera pacifica]MBO1518955.1 transposase [Oceanisphaera pacifica]
MTTARRHLIDVNSTPYYHVIHRCVRRAYLCGEDENTGRSYEHRRAWIIDRAKRLASIFCIDICAYAVMSNHYHLVLKIDVQTHQSLSHQDVVFRWLQVYSGSLVAKKFLNDEVLTDAEQLLLDTDIANWHERLGSISWFMSSLNQYISHKANQEDDCKGAFWDGRFRSQALIGEQALLACMMYVDLNPIRAGVANSLQDSDYTSIQQRIGEASKPTLSGSQPSSQSSPDAKKLPLKPLLAFAGTIQGSILAGIPFHFIDYLDLIDWTGRAIRNDKPGFIPSSQPSLLARLNISTESWIISAKEFNRQYSGICGRWSDMCAMKQKYGGKWCRGKAQSEALHPNG